MLAETTRRPAAYRPAATMACPSIWLPSTTGRRSSLRATVTKLRLLSSVGRTSMTSTRCAASPQVGKRLCVTSRGASPAASSVTSTRTRSWSKAM